jgi:hypothetical protein
LAGKSTSAQYRRRARELREMAQRAKSRERRTQLLRMARQYDGWAREIDQPKAMR